MGGTCTDVDECVVDVCGLYCTCWMAAQLGGFYEREHRAEPFRRALNGLDARVR